MKPPLRPFGLVLRRDGRWRHEGQPILNRKLRERFDRSVEYLPDEEAYVVRIGRFRGMIEIEETGFFVREVDTDRGTIRLSDGTVETLDPASLDVATDGALVCRVKRDLVPGGLPARFLHAAQADLLATAEDAPGGPAVRLAGALRPLPDAVAGAGE
jgi:hypothetical protein